MKNIYPFPTIVIGQKVVVKVPTLDLYAGLRGFIIATLKPKIGLSTAPDILIIFENGACERLSCKQAWATLTILHEPDIRYVDYEYEDMAIVAADFESGYWKFRKRIRR